MGKVSVTLNGRAFTIGCEDGQESYLRDLARHLDNHVTDLSRQVGQIGELRLLLMASLVVVDELKTAQNRLEALESHLTRLKSEGGSAAPDETASDGLVEALNGISARLEALAADETP
ncbi:cell division protein ZapA [Hyphobacterium sp. HN65]|uniref:Cell division protein ZapA n=1 Tax=Hyphobacterium lacteum TaxID=3116575 RepID=A0ABU7LPP9_9PROT|nr:cell division protein ZapA [Hyphobacterium sp. HN65]MEE2525888.1 cell division protein ZapA [Hyphobacterium sp. HN65]